MPYQPHDLFVFSGLLGSGADADVFQCGIRGEFPTGTTDPQRMDWLNAIKGSFATWFSAATSGMRSDATCNLLKVNSIGSDGKYTSGVTNQVSINAIGNKQPSVPVVCGAVFTWDTGFTHGPAHTGRIYPPVAPTFTGPGTSRITPASAGALAVAGQALIAGLATWSSSRSFVAGVFSRSSGTSRLITHTRVGDVVDVQRRRKNKLRETYYGSS